MRRGCAFFALMGVLSGISFYDPTSVWGQIEADIFVDQDSADAFSAPGQSVIIVPGQLPGAPVQLPTQGVAPAGRPPGEPPKPGEAKPGEAKDEAKIIKRGEAPPTAADPSEFEVKPDDDGLVSFRFRGQKWPDVIDWYSDTANVAIDWQELPNDYLNIESPKRYTLAQTRDLLNRHLLARGFTLLRHPGGLSVTKIAELSPASVPRVAPADLALMEMHEFVKVSFRLSTSFAHELVTELESVKSPNGKLVALAATNRIEAMDAVGNLLDMQTIIDEEEGHDPTAENVQDVYAGLHESGGCPQLAPTVSRAA
jgi:hypothetical protein